MQDVPAHLAPLRDALAALPGVRLALLFGSEARGQARADSDVDVAVLAGEMHGVAKALSDAIDRDVDVVDLRRAGIPLLEELLRNSRILYEGVPGAAALWHSRTVLQLEIDRPWYARMRDAWVARLKAEHP